ncbi:hypothetical protein TNCV_4534031 [Trichonephila clavipes]|nr:hypothetical protein TNCV_4534031 [Trichonephila clavipes]
MGSTGKECDLGRERNSHHWSGSSSPIGRMSGSEEKRELAEREADWSRQWDQKVLSFRNFFGGGETTIGIWGKEESKLTHPVCAPSGKRVRHDLQVSDESIIVSEVWKFLFAFDAVLKEGESTIQNFDKFLNLLMEKEAQWLSGSASRFHTTGLRFKPWVGNEKVSNHGSIPITIDCNVVAFIVFEEGFHQPIKRTKQSVFLDVTVFRHTLVD